jgi:hypothetical protein
MHELMHQLYIRRRYANYSIPLEHPAALPEHLERVFVRDVFDNMLSNYVIKGLSGERERLGGIHIDSLKVGLDICLQPASKLMVTRPNLQSGETPCVPKIFPDLVWTPDARLRDVSGGATA